MNWNASYPKRAQRRLELNYPASKQGKPQKACAIKWSICNNQLATMTGWMLMCLLPAAVLRAAALQRHLQPSTQRTKRCDPK
jgi:hypothetical protein